MSDYTKAKIYKITNDYNNDIYIGSTCDKLSKRFSNHKCARKYEDKKTYPLYTLMNEIGFERFRIQLIEDYPCDDKYQLRQREAYYIRELATLNQKIPFVTKAEKSERIKTYKSSENRKIIQKEESKQFYQNNKDKILEKNKEKSVCACGCELRKCDMARHEKSQKHLNFIMSSIKIE